jgi:hypothetical protein
MWLLANTKLNKDRMSRKLHDFCEPELTLNPGRGEQIVHGAMQCTEAVQESPQTAWRASRVVSPEMEVAPQRTMRNGIIVKALKIIVKGFL